MDSYEGSRSLDDLKNYLTLKISEHSLLSSATTENSESAEEVPYEAFDSDMQVTVIINYKAVVKMLCHGGALLSTSYFLAERKSKINVST